MSSEPETNHDSQKNTNTHTRAHTLRQSDRITGIIIIILIIIIIDYEQPTAVMTISQAVRGNVN